MGAGTQQTDIKDYFRSLRPRIAEGLETFEEEGGALLYNPASTHAVALNPSAQLVLELCDGERTTFEIARVLSEETGEDTATVFPSVVDTLLKLREKNVVEIDGLARTGDEERERLGPADLTKDRLDFRLPEFTRISWVDEDARMVWEERIERIQKAWQQIEWRSVSAGIRRCALVYMTPQDLVAAAARLLEEGVAVLPIAVQEVTQGDSGSPEAAAPGQPRLRVAVGSSVDALRLATAVQDHDSDAAGELLGYPPCCRRFFAQHCVQQALVDTTWPMAMNSIVSARIETDERLIDISSGEPWQANILWQWMGVRAVPHLPCSFRCAESVALSGDLIALGREMGLTQEMEWMEEILSWPVDWSALHGISEVKTPVLKVSTRTDATAHKFVVQKRGTRYPEEGASGANFPYRRAGSTGSARERA